jgi:hypothetical protein
LDFRNLDVALLGYIGDLLCPAHLAALSDEYTRRRDARSTEISNPKANEIVTSLFSKKKNEIPSTARILRS